MVGGGVQGGKEQLSRTLEVELPNSIHSDWKIGRKCRLKAWGLETKVEMDVLKTHHFLLSNNYKITIWQMQHSSRPVCALSMHGPLEDTQIKHSY